MGLDQYLYKAKIKCNDIEDLEILNTACGIKEAISKKGKEIKDIFEKKDTDEILKHFFNPIFVEKIKAGDKQAVEKFETIYKPECFKAYEMYKNTEENNLSVTEVGYWRKLYELQDYLRKLYYERGGKGEFNLQDIILSKEDCQSLLEYSYEKFNSCDDFEDDEEEKWQDAVVIFSTVLKETDFDKETIFYSSWW